VTRTRLHLETMSVVLPKAGHKLVLDEQTKGLLPLFSLGKTAESAGVKP
jgi:hypothetical protein